MGDYDLLPPRRGRPFGSSPRSPNKSTLRIVMERYHIHEPKKKDQFWDKRNALDRKKNKEQDDDSGEQG